MSPNLSSKPDRGSERGKPPRGRPASDRAQLLAAADRLFANTEAPLTVTMETIATAAGVGKATLFRAFGSREGLLNALWTVKLETLRAQLEKHRCSATSTATSEQDVIAFLDALLSFKLDNRRLIRARELTPGLLQSDNYRWTHDLLRHLLNKAARTVDAESAGYTAHVLLNGLHIDLIEEFLAGGLSVGTIRQLQAGTARAILAARRA